MMNSVVFLFSFRFFRKFEFANKLLRNLTANTVEGWHRNAIFEIEGIECL